MTDTANGSTVSICPNCDNPFHQPLDALLSGKPDRYCRSACFRQHTGIQRYTDVTNPAIVELLRITSTCEYCGGKFEQRPENVARGKIHRWCRHDCYEADKAQFYSRPGRQVRHPCGACAGPSDPEHVAYGLPICGTCRNVAHNSCWRKRVYTDSWQALRWSKTYREEGLDGEQSPYRCRLCDAWHLTSWAAGEERGDKLQTSILALAALIEDHNFDINRARGYTIMPDGTYQPYLEKEPTHGTTRR